MSRANAGETKTLLARLVAESPDVRRDLAAGDPTAIFGLLAGLPASIPAPPLPALPPRAARELGGRRALLAGIAATLAGVALLAALAPPAARSPEALVAENRETKNVIAARDEPALPALVERVGSATAEVVTLVPPSAGGPVVTLVLDEGIDL